MSIDKAREVLACRFGLTIAQDVEAFVDAKLDARLSPAPVGGTSIADLEQRLAEAERDRDYWHRKWLALSPATDKGGE